MIWQSLLFKLFHYGLLIYAILLMLCYLFIAIYSINEVRSYLQISSFSKDRELILSSLAPSITIIAPAYNESTTIIENIRSLLSVHYENMELILVNDGSKDDTLKKLIDNYELSTIPLYYHPYISTKPIKHIYKSNNAVFDKLIVVDKENGGKADALNAGINISSKDIIVCIDVDCILEQTALIKIIKSFLDTVNKPVICAGGVIRIANSCIIEDGQLIKVNLPDQMLPRIQTLEYIRAFLLGRMAWSRLNGLLIVSGAFGAFEKQILIQTGGYDTRTVGEDMELVVRMRRLLEEKKVDYRIKYIPDPLCWTEAPSDYTVLGRQRSRWMRGLSETLHAHRRMFFNPNYKVLGMLSYPFWFFYEFLAPVVETVGILFFLFFCILGMVDWPYFFELLLFVTLFGCLFSLFAVLMEVLSFNQYKSRKDILKLIATAFIEPFVFHPFIVFSSIRGLYNIYKQKKGWGAMTRQGFQNKTS